MTIFEFVFVVYFVVNVILGFRYGFFRRLVHVGGFYLGMLLANLASIGISQQLGYGTGDHPAASHFGVYFAIVLFFVIVSEAIGIAYNSVLSFMNSLPVDRILGLLLGGVATVFEIGVLVYMFNNLLVAPVPSGAGQSTLVTSTAEQLHRSWIEQQVVRLQPAVLVVFLPVLPPEPRAYFAKTYS